MDNIEQYLKDSYVDFTKNSEGSNNNMPPFNKIHYPEDTPQQIDGDSCGVYICAFMKMEMLGLPVTDFNDPRMINGFRGMMATDLLHATGRLQKET